jgi:hypothetical protein
MIIYCGYIPNGMIELHKCDELITLGDVLESSGAFIDEFKRARNITTDVFVEEMYTAMIEKKYEYTAGGLKDAIRDEQYRIFTTLCVVRNVRALVDGMQVSLHTVMNDFQGYVLNSTKNDVNAHDDAAFLSEKTMQILSIASIVDLLARIHREMEDKVAAVIKSRPGEMCEFCLETVDLDNIMLSMDGIVLQENVVMGIVRLKQRSRVVDDYRRGVVKIGKRANENLIKLGRWLDRVDSDIDLYFGRPMTTLENRIHGFDLQNQPTKIYDSFERVFFVDEQLGLLIGLFQVVY